MPHARNVPVPLRLMLPREHGAWAFLLLPITAGLVTAPSWAGALVALGALSVFLARGPFQAGRSGLPALLVLGGIGAALFGLGVWKGGGVTLFSLLGAALLGLPLLARSTKDMRNLVSETLALLACGALLPAILGAGGASAGEAFRGWVLIVLLALPPLVHLRHRLAQGRKGLVPKPPRAALGAPGGSSQGRRDERSGSTRFEPDAAGCRPSPQPGGTTPGGRSAASAPLNDEPHRPAGPSLRSLPPDDVAAHGGLGTSPKGEAPRFSKAAVLLQLLATCFGFGLWCWNLAPGLIPLWTSALLIREFSQRPASARRLGWTEAMVSLGHLGILWISLTGL